jgi:hypothetical protein
MSTEQRAESKKLMVNSREQRGSEQRAEGRGQRAEE